MPVRAILAQAAWASVLALSGSYDALTDSVIFASWLFYGLMQRRRCSYSGERCRTRRGPIVRSAIRWCRCMFLLVTAALLVNTFVAAPSEALQGVAVLLAGCRSIGIGRGRRAEVRR